MSFLIGTNVVSELRKRTPDRNVVAWYEAAPSPELFLSALTIGEISLGIERLRRRDSAQAAVLEQWLYGLRTRYRDRIVPVDPAIAEEWGKLSAGDPLPVVDGLLAATASVHEWTLVTRSTCDLTRCGVRLLDPFEPRSP